jgi:hypothetical protein
MKTIIKLAVVIVIANGIWRLGTAYMSYYRFKDAVADLAVHSTGMTVEQVKDRVVELAAAHDEPIAADAIAVRREEHHTFVDGSYTKPVAVLQGYEYPWPFSLNVDGFVIVPVKVGDLANPQ